MHVLVISAEGRGFCAGVDIKELGAHPERIVPVNKGNYDTFEAIHRNPKPVIVACNGPEAFGTYAGGVDEKLELLHTAAEAGARFVDELTTRKRVVQAMGSAGQVCLFVASSGGPVGTRPSLLDRPCNRGLS